MANNTAIINAAGVIESLTEAKPIRKINENPIEFKKILRDVYFFNLKGGAEYINVNMLPRMTK